jgi:hypothetical protein
VSKTYAAHCVRDKPSHAHADMPSRISTGVVDSIQGGPILRA